MKHLYRSRDHPALPANGGLFYCHDYPIKKPNFIMKEL